MMRDCSPSASPGIGRTEVVDETDIVALHNYTSRDEHAPKNGLGIQSDALTESHGLLLPGGRPCMVDDGPVDFGRIVFGIRGIMGRLNAAIVHFLRRHIPLTLSLSLLGWIDLDDTSPM